MKDMDNFNRIPTDAIENQKSTEGTPANPEMLVARQQRVAARGVQQRFASFPQLADQLDRTS